jgi:hypothetical protein
MSVASVNNGSLQLSELVISNEKYSAASGYVASSSTFTSSTSGVSIASITVGVPESSTTLTSNGSDSLVVNGGTGPINCGALYCENIISSGDITTTSGIITASEGFVSTGGNTVINTYTDPTFAITRNISDGNNEWDIVAINGTDSTQCLNIFAGNGTTEINNGTIPMLSIGTDGVSMTNEVSITNFGDAGAAKFDTANTLNITQNVSSGLGEIDFVSICPTSTTGMNFYVSQTEIEGAVSTPVLSLATTGATVNGVCTAQSFAGGIGMALISPTIPELTTDAFSALPNQTIPNFVGSSGSVYIAVPLGGSVAGFNPYSFISGFDSTDGTDTTVYLSVSNLSGGTIPSLPISVALLAINNSL